MLPRKNAPKLKGIPFLLTHHNSRSVASECSKCLRNNNLHSLCSHDDKERAFVDCWTIFEICYALTLGYEIVQVYEAFLYFQQDFIFKDYMSFLARTKILHSNMPTDNIQDHLNEINNSMNFTGEDEITIKDLSPNQMTKTYIKDQMNIGLGNLKNNA